MLKFHLNCYLHFITLIVLLLSTFNSVKSFAFEVHGHRGARALHSENSLPAFLYAMEIGVDVLELDTNWTQDHVIVVYHDPQLNKELCRTPDGKLLKKDIFIDQFQYADLLNYDCYSTQNKKFPKQKSYAEQHLPTLGDVFKLVKAFQDSRDHKSKSNFKSDFKLNIEIKKYSNSINYSQMIAQMFALVKSYELEDQVIYQSFDRDILLEMRKQDPAITTSFLVEGWWTGVRGFFDLGENYFVTLANQAQADIVSPDYRLISADDILDLHEAGIRVIPWTVNNRKKMRSLIQKGVDGIISDDPQLVLTTYRELSQGR